jgi:thiamine-monophosphate kinase
MSISATVMGIVKNQNVLTRRAARPGDTIFVSRSIGRTPAAFAYHFRCLPTALTPEQIGEINGQFMNLEPMVELGQKLAASGVCSSCMDNTDGLGQTLIELAENSRVAFHIQKTKLRIDELVTKVAESASLEVTTLALSAGADFSLVGTLRGLWSEDEANEKLGLTVQFIGSVVDGEGAWLCSHSDRERITCEGWNYFAPSGLPFRERTDE